MNKIAIILMIIGAILLISIPIKNSKKDMLTVKDHTTDATIAIIGGSLFGVGVFMKLQTIKN